MITALLLLLGALLGLGALLIEGGRLWAALGRLVPAPPPAEEDKAPPRGDDPPPA